MKEWWNPYQTWIGWIIKISIDKKGKVGIGYKEEGESSKQVAQKKKNDLLAITVVR